MGRVRSANLRSAGATRTNASDARREGIPANPILLQIFQILTALKIFHILHDYLLQFDGKYFFYNSLIFYQQVFGKIFSTQRSINKFFDERSLKVRYFQEN